MGRREAWSAQKSEDSRTKPTQWEFSRRVNNRQKLQHEHVNEEQRDIDKNLQNSEDQRSLQLR